MPIADRPETELIVPQRAVITPMSVLEIAVQQGADIEKLTALMALQERWEANQARKSYNTAMAEFKKNPPRIEKNKHVKAGKGPDAPQYWHPTLDHVTDTITAALSAVGISHKWKVNQTEQIAVTCVLTHEMGHSEETTLRAAADTSGSKNSIQAIGSTVTYLERYTLLAAVGMAAVGIDNDGQGDKLPEPEVMERVNWIKAARDLPETKKIFGAAYKWAQEGKDTGAMSELIKAYEGKKEEFHAHS